MRRVRGNRPLALSALVLGLWSAGYGCSDTITVLAPVESVVITPPQATIVAGEEISLEAIARDIGGHPLEGRSVQWSSTDQSIASVGPSGSVRGLAVGDVSIQATSEGILGSAQIVVVEPPEINLATHDVHFQGVGGGPPTGPVFVEVRNQLAGTLAGLTVSTVYPSGTPDGWLEAELSGTTAPTSLRLVASPEMLAGGIYEAEVLVSAPTASNSPARIVVTFDVESRAPTLRLDPSAVGFSAAEDRPVPAPQTVAVTNTGEGVLSGLSRSIAYQSGGPTGWLTAQLGGTTTPASLTLGVNPGQLAIGTYEAMVSVSSPVAVNSPQSIRVRLTVGDPPPEIELTPTSVSMIYVDQASNLPPPETVEISNLSDRPLGEISVEASYPSGPVGWLDLDLSSSEAPSQLTLSVVEGVLPLQAYDVYEATVTVVAPEAVNSPRSFEVTLSVAPRPSAGNSTINASPGSITADGSSTSTITVQLRDAQGSPIPYGGNAVSLSTTEGTLSSVTDAGNGAYRATLRSSTTPGIATVSGAVDGVTIGDDVQVEFVPGAASPLTSTIAANPTSIVADGASTSEITVTLRDANGNELTGGGNSVGLETTRGSLSSVTDRGDGTYSATLTSATTIGIATITGTVNGEDIDDDAQVTFTPGLPIQYVVTVTPTTTPAAGASVTVRAQLADAHGNPVAQGGRTVHWTATNGGTFASQSTTTSAGGLATVSFTTDTTLGTSHVVRASDGQQTSISGTSPTITTQVGAATQYLVSVSSEMPDAGAAVTVTARLADANGNPVSEGGRTVNWTATNGGEFSQASTTTNGAGVTTVTFTTSGSGGTTHVVTATDGANSSITGESPTITTQAVASSLRYRVTVSDTEPMFLSQVTVTAQLVDLEGNEVSEGGRTVNWSATNGGGFSSNSSTTDASGVATVTFTVSLLPGIPHVVTATDDADSTITGESPVITTQLL